MVVNLDWKVVVNLTGFSTLETNIKYQNKYDSRRIGFSLNYKFPSKNKVVKEENILINDKKEEKTIDK